ncbi:MAG: flagellar export protein FliJ [Bdellovibrionaceae bacterium]|nr:flagellar export protein FliJ [Pseudobdellovibrionaceae bacterium]
MKFKFPYEKLLDHRKTLEEVARKEYSVARAAVDDAETELKAMYDSISDSRQRAGGLEMAGGAQGPALTMIGDFISGQKVRIERQRQKVRELLTVAEQKQDALIEAAKEHKTLQKLRERRLKELKRLLKKKELKEVDEMVTSRFKREDI